MTKPRGRWKSDTHKQKWLRSKQGQEWLARKIEEKHANRPAIAPVKIKTKFPFAATINDDPVIVWPDWIEYEDTDDYLCGVLDEREAPDDY